MSSLFRRLSESGGVAVAPSILSADFTGLEREIGDVERAGADFLHLDVMDGHFVPNITFGPMIVEAVSRTASVPLLTHLMISDPACYAKAFVEAGSALVSFHFEAVERGHEEIIGEIESNGAVPGIAINPDTQLAAVEHLLPAVGCLVIMTVFPGFGGQRFIADVLPKIEAAARLRSERGHRFVIEVDGGIKPENAGSVRDAGGQVLVAGTAVFGSGDYAGAIRAIRGGAERP